jgi:hypothetical protein
MTSNADPPAPPTPKVSPPDPVWYPPAPSIPPPPAVQVPVSIPPTRAATPWGAAPPAPAPARALRRRLAAGDTLLALIGLPIIAALCAAAAAAPWLRAFSVPGATITLGLAAVVPVVVAVIIAQLARLPVAISYGASLLALVAFVAIALSPHPDALATVLAHEPTRLLTETLPLRGGRVLLIAPVLVVWVTAAATAEVLARSARPGAAPALPVVSYLLAFAVTAGAPANDQWTGPALLAAIAVLALGVNLADARSASAQGAAARPASVNPRTEAGSAVAGQRSPGATRWRGAVVGAGLAAVLVAALAYGVPRIAALGGRAASLARRPQVTSQLVVDPVDAIGALRDNNPSASAQALLTVSTSAPSTGYFGIATLDDYNGDTWSFDTTFHPTGGRVPAAPAGEPGVAAADMATVRQTYALRRNYGLAFIPMLDRPQLVSGVTVDLDPSTGMAVPAQTLALPSVYSVVSASPDATLGRLSNGAAIDAGQSATAAASDLGLPAGTGSDLSTALQLFAGLTHQRPTPTVGFLQAVVTALHRDFRRVDPALDSSSRHASVTRGGTSLAEVINAVTVGRRATPEQFATLFVLVARDLGIPARLVTGFRVQPPAGSSSLAAGTVTVTNRQAWTWAEIPVEGLGWVVADPTPAATASSVAQPASKAQSTTPTTVAPRQAKVVPEPTVHRTQALAPPVSIHPRGHRGPPAWVRWLVVAGLILALLLLFGPVLAALRRYARRRRRRRGSPADRAAGAWLELLDGLDLAGLSVPETATTSEVVREVSRRFGDDLTQPVTLVATVAERAVCSLIDPPDDATARQVWTTQRAVGRNVRRHTSPSVRLRGLLRVAPAPRQPSSPRGRTTRWGRPARRRPPVTTRVGGPRPPGTDQS